MTFLVPSRLRAGKMSYGRARTLRAISLSADTHPPALAPPRCVSMSFRLYLLAAPLALVLFGLGRGPSLPAADPAPAPTFAKEGVAFLAKNCTSCHGGKAPKADLSLQALKTESDL